MLDQIFDCLRIINGNKYSKIQAYSTYYEKIPLINFVEIENYYKKSIEIFVNIV